VNDCTKKNHQQLQKAIPSRRGPDGIYDGIIRGKNAKHPDGIASTWMSFKACDLLRAIQRGEMESVGLSSQRQAVERLASPRGDPLVTFNNTLLATPVTSPRKQAPTPMPSLIPAGESAGFAVKTPVVSTATVDLTQEPASKRNSRDGSQRPHLAAPVPDALTAQLAQISKLMEVVAMMAMSQNAMTQSQNTAAAKMEHLTTTFDNAFEALREKRPHQDPLPPPPVTKWHAVARGRVPGEDSSKGEAEKIYGASICTGEAVKLLSPPHSGTETMEDLMEAVPDVTSPGELVDSSSEANEQMANSLQSLAEQNAQRTNVMMKDTQWKNKARSALSKVKSLETLVKLCEEVDEQQLKVGELAKHAVAKILRRACWPESLIEQHLETGGIVRLVERSQFLWMQLLMHSQKLQKGTDQWESTAQLHVEHFTKKSLVTRKPAPTRFFMVQEVCCLLRDDAVKRFVSLALSSRVAEHVQTRLLIDSNKPSDSSPGDALARTKSQRCSHCHSSSVDECGTYNCVLKTWKSKIARTLATEIARRAMTGDELLNVVLAEVLEWESNNKG
jgi:hypothetical protein